MSRPGTLATLAAVLLASAAGPAQAEGPAVWAVTGRANTVYLFGSVHLLRAGDYEFGGALEEAYADAESLYLEVDPDELSPAALAVAAAARAVDPDGRSLFDLLGDDADDARRLARAASIDLSLLTPFEPWFAGITVTALALAQHGYVAEAGVERQLLVRAAADGKPALGLETLDEQLALLDGLAATDQRAFLLKSLQDAARVPTEVAELVAAWRAGDAGRLAGLLEDEFSAASVLYDTLIAARNDRWAARIEALLEHDQDYLVVVGALHLVGRDGLPAQLGRSGFPVERLDTRQ